MIRFDIKNVQQTIEDFISNSNVDFVADLEWSWSDLQQEDTFKAILQALEIKNSPEQDYDSPKKFNAALRPVNKSLLMQIAFEIGVLYGACLWRNNHE